MFSAASRPRFLQENPGWIVPGQEVLCVADGEGRNSVWLAGHGGKITAFDGAPTVGRGHGGRSVLIELIVRRPH